MKRTNAFILMIFTLSITPVAYGNVVGGDTQNFNPTIGTSEFVTVQSTTTTPAGFFHLGLFLNYAVNTLPYQDEDLQHEDQVNDTVTGSDAFVGYGITNNLDFGISFPFVISQTVKNSETHGEFEKTGNTDIRVSARYRLLQSGKFGLATIANVNINRTESNPHTGADTSPLYSIEFAADYGFGRSLIGANIGYRWRDPGETIEGSLIDPIRNQALMSLAFAYALTSDWSLTSELYGAKSLTDVRNDTNRSLDSNEALLGARYHFSSATKFHMGGGGELSHGLSSPDWRVYLGVTTLLGPEPKEKVASKRPEKKRVRRPPPPSADDLPSENPIPEVHQTPDEIFVLDDIHFKFDSDYRILPGGVSELQKLADHLAKTGFRKLIVEGHTDSYGTDAYNIDLSFRRAKTIRRHLIKYHLLNPADIMAIGYGETRPIADNITDEGRQQNRRVEIKIYK